MTGYDSKRQMAADKMQEHWNEDEWRRNNWRCGHGWLRGEQCESCNAPQPAQEPVAYLWECLGRWSAYLVTNGKQADCAPPSWLVDAINKATTPPQRTWIWLSDADIAEVVDTTCQYSGGYEEYLIKKAERKIKELNT